MLSFKEFIIEDPEQPKKKTWAVVRYDQAKNNATKIVDNTTVHASNKKELHDHIRNWMDKIGLDPDDEDDHSYINWGPHDNFKHLPGYKPKA